MLSKRWSPALHAAWALRWKANMTSSERQLPIEVQDDISGGYGERSTGLAQIYLGEDLTGNTVTSQRPFTDGPDSEQNV